MVTFDTTATAESEIHFYESSPNTPQTAPIDIRSSSASDARAILGFRVPDRPRGVDRIYRVRVVLTTRYDSNPSSATRTILAYKIGQLWRGVESTSGTSTWNSYVHPSNAWGTAGGDLGEYVAAQAVTGGYGASFAWDVSSLDVDWGENFSLLFKDASEDAGTTRGYIYFAAGSSGNTTSTVAWKPHLVVTAVDDPPSAINDLHVEPDVSLSESTYLFRQRAVVKWSPD